jgi:endonuclease/exonuclease/phosphatase family metal-dependent hydrolase
MQIKKIQLRFLLLILLLPPYFSVFAQCENQLQEKIELKILSWNIYMLPHIALHTGQRERAKEIVETLKTENVDVIVFEEAFDKTSRNIIREGLKKYFKYESGDPTKNIFYKTNSGVWVISKVPIKVIKQIYFKNSRGCDRMACKGATLIQAKKDKFCFQIVATHLQSDLKNTDVTEIRKTQYQQIRKELLEPYAQSEVPQFVVGDMNTVNTDSIMFNQMLDILRVKQCVFEGEHCYSYDRMKNDIILKSTDKPQLIDYIFFDKKQRLNLEGRMLVKIFRKKWSANNLDLSDHFAVLGTFTLKETIFNN